MLALDEYRRGICDCGLHEQVAQDKTNYLTFEDTYCPVCAGMARYARVRADQDEKLTPENPSPGAVLPADGRHIRLRGMSEDEVAEREARRRPSSRPPGSRQPSPPSTAGS